jgi:hypothetical protein
MEEVRLCSAGVYSCGSYQEVIGSIVNMLPESMQEEKAHLLLKQQRRTRAKNGFADDIAGLTRS